MEFENGIVFSNGNDELEDHNIRCQNLNEHGNGFQMKTNRKGV